MPTDDHLRASDWRVEPIGQHADALAFVRQHHYSKGGSKMSTCRHGLYREDGLWPLLGEVFGVALWNPPLPGVGATVSDDPAGVLVLSRLAVHPDVPTNGASFLLGRSMRLLDRTRWHTLLTYADTALGHTGAIYKATNWTCVGEITTSGEVWANSEGVRRGRKNGDSRLTHVDLRAMGFEKLPKMPKLKFVHVARHRARAVAA